MAELYESSSLSNNNLVYNPETLVTKNITLLNGQNVVRGDVIGEVTLAVPTTGTEDNTGTAACGSVAGGANTELGTYTLTCKSVASHVGTFEVKTPSGAALPNAVQGVAYSNPHINFTIAAVGGGTDFVAGDKFTIPVTAGSGKYVKAVATNVNGSNQVDNMLIAANDIDASGGDAVGTAYASGVFNDAEITIDSSYTLANIADELGRKGIFFKTAIPN